MKVRASIECCATAMPARPRLKRKRPSVIAEAASQPPAIGLSPVTSSVWAISCASGESTSTNGARFAHAAPHTWLGLGLGLLLLLGLGLGLG